MNKIIFLVSIIILDLFLYNYLNSINISKKAYNYNFDNNYVLIQTDDIILNNKEELNFDNYFKIYSFVNKKYNVDINEAEIEIKIDDNIFITDYELIKPKVIKEKVYIETNKEINNTVVDTTNSNYFYVNNNYFEFPIDTDINYIRSILANNINTTYQTSIDYSMLNSSYVGQYSVFYICDKEKIEIIVSIV